MNGGDRFGDVNGSNLTGTANMMADGMYAAYKYEASNHAKNWASKAGALKVAKYVSYTGKSLGVLGAGFTAIESFADGNFSYGDAAKVGPGPFYGEQDKLSKDFLESRKEKFGVIHPS